MKQRAKTQIRLRRSIIAVDVGNSNIHIGIFTESEVRLPKSRKSMEVGLPYYRNPPQADNIQHCFVCPCHQKARFIAFLKKQKKIHGLILSDAYGKTSISKSKEFQKITRTLPNFILLTPQIDCGLKINYKPRSSLGTDRIANCVAAYTIYQRDCLIIDFGTATTFNVVSKQGEFLGGLILPGISAMYNSLPKHLTRHLRLKIQNPQAIEITTSQAVNSGLYFLVVGIINKVKKEMEQQLKTKLYTIATGKGINLIPKLKTIFDNIDEHLTLKGLVIIYQRIKL